MNQVMATHHTREKQKKGVMYVYKLDTGNSKPKGPADSTAVTVKRGIINSGISWGLRRSKTVREVVDHGRVKTREDEKEIVESRKSVCSEASAGRKSVSNLEVNVASVASFLQVKVMVTDMPGFMQVHAFRCARGTYDSLEKFSSKHMAYNMKKDDLSMMPVTSSILLELDDVYNIYGRNLTRYTGRPGIALWAQILDPLSHTQLVASSISRWKKCTF